MFVPSAAGPSGSGAPLVVALHGCTQTAGDFAAGTRFDAVAEGAGAYVVYPEYTAAANAQRCWNWFRAEDQSRDSGQPGAILALVDDVARRFPIDRKRVYVTGLSVISALLARQFAHLLGLEGEAVLERRSGAEIAHWCDASGRVRIELWSVAKLGHMWSGGSFRGSFTNPSGPRASDEMMAFFSAPPSAKPAARRSFIRTYVRVRRRHV